MLFAVISYGAFEGAFGCDFSLEQACSSLPRLFCCGGEPPVEGQFERLERVFCDRDARGVARGALKYR